MSNILKKVGDLAGFLNYNFEKYFVSKFLGNVLLGREVSGRVYACPKDIRKKEEKVEETPKSQNHRDYGNPIMDALNYLDDDSLPYNTKRTTKEMLELHDNPPYTEELEIRIEKIIFETRDDFKDLTDPKAIANSINREMLIKHLLGYYVDHVQKEKRLPELNALAKELRVGIEYMDSYSSLSH